MSDFSETEPNYILDTEAIRSIGGDKLRAAVAKHARLFVSPISVYEILCHLDEGNFKMFRSILLKCKIPQMLPDPWAHHATYVGAELKTNPTHFDEAQICEGLLLVLEKANSLAEFYGQHLKLSDGSQPSLKDCAAHARQVLGAAENDYLKNVKNVMDELLKLDSKESIIHRTEIDHARDVFSALTELRKDYLGGNVPPDRLAVAVTNSMFVHYGYRFSRVYECIRSQAKPNGNDTEDSLLCIYVNVLEPTILVTTDDGTVEAVRKSVQSFNAYFAWASDKNVRGIPHHERQVRAYFIHKNTPTGTPNGDWFKAEDELRELLTPIAECSAIKPAEFLARIGV